MRNHIWYLIWIGATVTACGSQEPKYEARVIQTGGSEYMMDCSWREPDGKHRSYSRLDLRESVNVRGKGTDFHCTLARTGGQFYFGPLEAELLRDGKVVSSISIGKYENEAELRSEPAEEPEGVVAKTLGEVKGKVGPLVELSATPKGEPGRYQRLGHRRFFELSDLDRWAALYIATSPQCDLLKDVDTRASTREELIWIGRCENGLRYVAYEMDVREARQKLSRLRDSDSIEGIAPPKPTRQEARSVETQIAACSDAFQPFAQKDAQFLPDKTTIDKQHSDHRSISVRGKMAKSAFAETPYEYQCVVQTDPIKVTDFRYRIGAEWRTPVLSK